MSPANYTKQQAASSQDPARRLKDLDDERAVVKDQLDRERLVKVTQEVIQTLTSPPFVEKMRQARSTATGESSIDLAVASDMLSLDALRQAGADIPADFRMTSRTFEDRASGIRLDLKSDAPSAPEDLLRGWGGCAGAGTLGTCGCGGFHV